MEFLNEFDLATHIHRLGGNLWLVGGAVRDGILRQPVHDMDFLATGLNPSDLPFDRVAGRAFPVFLVRVDSKACELALARKERKNGVGHSGFQFFTDASVSIEQDLARRDLTINAMAEDILTGQIIDPFGGREDLKRGILRHTTDAFAEDPLRVFRVARFAAKFDFEVSRETMALMRRLAPELPLLPPERVWDETKKAIATTTRPSRFFEVLREAGALDAFFPEVAALDVPDKHDGTAFAHTMRVMDKGRTFKDRFGLLVHDFGKGLTPPEFHPNHHGHDKAGVEAVERFCRRLRVPNRLREFGRLCAGEHMRIKRAAEMRPGKFVRWALGLERHFNELLRVSFFDSVCREGANLSEESERFRKINRMAQEVFDIRRRFTGKALIREGARPGKHLGEILFQRRVEAFKSSRPGFSP